MTTPAKPNRLEELKSKHAAELAELQARESIVALLPESIPVPTISNVTDKPPVRAWLSFSPEYGTDPKAFALLVLTELEKHGAKPVPVSLCKWGQYRRSTYPALVDEVPESKLGCFGSTDELTDVEPIAPLWVEPCQFTGVEVRAYYEIAGAIYKVAVKAPMAAHLSCRRVEYRGGWRFEGPATVNFPQQWHALYAEGGECVANVSQHTRGYRDTEQGITGVIYFQPLTEQADFPLTPAGMLAQLFI